MSGIMTNTESVIKKSLPRIISFHLILIFQYNNFCVRRECIIRQSFIFRRQFRLMRQSNDHRQHTADQYKKECCHNSKNDLSPPLLLLQLFGRHLLLLQRSSTSRATISSALHRLPPLIFRIGVTVTSGGASASASIRRDARSSAIFATLASQL